MEDITEFDFLEFKTTGFATIILNMGYFKGLRRQRMTSSDSDQENFSYSVLTNTDLVYSIEYEEYTRILSLIRFVPTK